MTHWHKRKYTPKQFTEAWESSPSIRQVALKLNLDPRGDAYRVLQRAADDLGLSKAHMGKVSRRNKFTITPLPEILVKNSSYTNTSVLKRRLIKGGLLKYICSICGIVEHNYKPITLQIDHINGDKLDHRLENLRLLCPNCHSQTETYKGKNIKG